MTITIEFRGETLEVRIEKYRNTDLTRINLYTTQGEPYMTATSTVAGLIRLGMDEPNPDLVAIKDYSENEGIFAAMINAGVIEDTGHSIRTPFVDYPIARVLHHEDKTDEQQVMDAIADAIGEPQLDGEMADCFHGDDFDSLVERSRETEQEAQAIVDWLAGLGHEALWAKGKGGGFWIKGFRYVSWYEAKHFLQTGKWNTRD